MTVSIDSEKIAEFYESADEPLFVEINSIYINGAFVAPNGIDFVDLRNSITTTVIGRVRLGDEIDDQAATTAANFAFDAFSRTDAMVRASILFRMHKELEAQA